MRFKEKETCYGKAAEVKMEMAATVPCVDQYSQGDILDLKLSPTNFDEGSCTGCDFFEFCKAINDINSTLDKHKL